jgi:hypothetical protein
VTANAANANDTTMRVAVPTVPVTKKYSSDIPATAEIPKAITGNNPRTMGSSPLIAASIALRTEVLSSGIRLHGCRRPPTAVKLTHFLLALAVMAIWGTNFVVIAWGLESFPPLMFAALRFFFSAVPALFFIKRPATPWRYLAAYGVLLGAGQFGLLFLAMHGHITPGLASLIVQMQVIFTIALSVAMFRERVPAAALVGTTIAVAGLATVGAHLDATVTPLGLALILCAAFCWAGANVTVKLAARRGARFNMLGFIVWSSIFAVPALLLLSLAFEGSRALASIPARRWAHGRRWLGRRWATRSSASPRGAGCWRSTTRRR